MLNPIDQFRTMVNTTMETAQRFASLSCDEAQRLFKLQMDALGAVFVSNSKHLKSLLDNGDAKKAIAQWTEVAGANAQGWVDIQRACNEVATKSQTQWLSLVTEGMGAFGKAYLESLALLTGKASAGEEKSQAG